MLSNSNKERDLLKDYPTTECVHDISTDDVVKKIRCWECYKSIVAGLNLRTNRVTTYEIDGYPNQLIEHPHRADVVTTTDLQHRTAIEFRHIRRPNKNDHDYLIDNRRRVFSLN